MKETEEAWQLNAMHFGDNWEKWDMDYTLDIMRLLLIVLDMTVVLLVTWEDAVLNRWRLKYFEIKFNDDCNSCSNSLANITQLLTHGLKANMAKS